MKETSLAANGTAALNQLSEGSKTAKGLKRIAVNQGTYRRLIKKRRPLTKAKVPSKNASTKQRGLPSSKQLDCAIPNIKDHLEVIEANLTNPKKSADVKIASIGMLFLIALKNKKFSKLEQELMQWAANSSDKQLVGTLKDLIEDELPEPVKPAPRAKDRARQANLKRVAAVKPQRLSAEERFKLNMGDRLYKTKEITTLENPTIRNLNMPLPSEEPKPRKRLFEDNTWPRRNDQGTSEKEGLHKNGKTS